MYSFRTHSRTGLKIDDRFVISTTPGTAKTTNKISKISFITAKIRTFHIFADNMEPNKKRPFQRKSLESLHVNFLLQGKPLAILEREMNRIRFMGYSCSKEVMISRMIEEWDKYRPVTRSNHP